MAFITAAELDGELLGPGQVEDASALLEHAPAPTSTLELRRTKLMGTQGSSRSSCIPMRPNVQLLGIQKLVPRRRWPYRSTMFGFRGSNPWCCGEQRNVALFNTTMVNMIGEVNAHPAFH